MWPVMAARSDPQMPASRGRSRTQSGPGRAGSGRSPRLSIESEEVATSALPPAARTRAKEGIERTYWSASIPPPPDAGSCVAIPREGGGPQPAAEAKERVAPGGAHQAMRDDAAPGPTTQASASIGGADAAARGAAGCSSLAADVLLELGRAGVGHRQPPVAGRHPPALYTPAAL